MVRTAPRRKTRFIRETFSYALGIGSVAAIALVREVNLLVFITGLLFVPLLINSYLARASLYKIGVRRRLPEGVCAGEPCIAEVEIDLPSRHSKTWTLLLTDHFQQVEPKSLASVEAPLSISMIARQKEPKLAKADYRIVAQRRGKYQFGPIDASTRYPLGFVESRIQFPAQAQWLVLPRLGLLLPEWRHEVETHRQGEQNSHSRRGVVEGEFHGLRQWRDGDSRRWIHWRTTARSGQLMVRQFERQRNQDLIILVDLWRPADPGAEDTAYVELAVSFLATLVDDLCRQGTHRLCIYLKAEKPLVWSGVTSQLALTELLAELAVVEPANSPALPNMPSDFLGNAQAGVPILHLTTRRSEAADMAHFSAGNYADQAFTLCVPRGDLTEFFTDRDET